MTHPAVDPGLPFRIDVRYENLSRTTTVTGVVITVTGEGITGFRDLPEHCTASGTTATCTVGTLGVRYGENSGTFTLTAVAPDQSHAPLSLTASIAAREVPVSTSRAHTFHTYLTRFVTSTADAGPGSLRDAIHESNVACTDPKVWCKIAFRIPTAAARTHRIRPDSPLPEVRGANVSVDGATQTRYVADSNPNGPEVELDGSALHGDTNGLTLSSNCIVEVRGLIIHSFPNNGILASGPGECTYTLAPRIIAGNFVGTDAAGMEARPNRRGIFIDGAAANISRNLISGNTRSGVYIANGFQSLIVDNTIGLTRTLQPLGNGASGIYLAAGARGTDAIGNYIGFNAHYGVALDRGSVQSAITANSYQANGGLAIDFGLDGVTPIIEEGFVGPLHMPVITNAWYDAAQNATVIEGTAAQPRATSVRVYLFANDAPDESGYGEGQYTLGHAEAGRDGTWRFVHPGRTPGPWIAAIAARYYIHGVTMPRPNNIGGGAETMTSEFSRTVEVQFPPQ